MMSSVFTFLIFFSLFAACCLSDATLSVEGQFAMGKMDTSNIRLTLNGKAHATLSTVDGRFKFYDVASGIYLLDVSDPRYIFSQFKVKVTAETGSVSVIEYKFPGAQRLPVAYPLKISPLSGLAYFQRHEKVSIWKTIMNPTMLMVVFSVGIIFFIPMMMKNIGKFPPIMIKIVINIYFFFAYGTILTKSLTFPPRFFSILNLKIPKN